MRPKRFHSNCCGIDWSCRLGCPCLLEELHRAVQSGKNTTGRERRQLVLWCRLRGGRKSGSKLPHSKSDDDGFLVFAEDAAEGVGDFADGGVGFDGGEDGGEEILGGGGAALEFGEAGFGEGGVALGAECVQAGDLGAFDFGVEAERRDGAFFFRDEVVHADNALLFLLDGALELVSRFLDFALDETGFNGAQHSAHLVDLRKIDGGKRFDFVGEGFDGVGAGDGIDGVGNAGFVREDLLGAQETGVANTDDPVAGSYAIESLTNEIESLAAIYLSKIDKMGGMLRAIEAGFVQGEIQKAAYEFQRAVEKKEQIVVGVNDFVAEEERTIPTLRVDAEIERSQIARLNALRAKRDSALAKSALAELQRRAATTENLLPAILAAVESYATVGEISDALRRVFGEYPDSVVI